MFVIMSKAKYYAMEMLIGSFENRCDGMETLMQRNKKRIAALEEVVDAQGAVIDKLSARLQEMESDYREMTENAEKAEKAFSEGVSNILNYAVGGDKK